MQTRLRDFLLGLAELKNHAPFVRLHRVDRLEHPQDKQTDEDDGDDDPGATATARKRIFYLVLAAANDFFQVRRCTTASASRTAWSTRPLTPGALVVSTAAVLVTPGHRFLIGSFKLSRVASGTNPHSAQPSFGVVSFWRIDLHGVQIRSRLIPARANLPYLGL